MPLTDRNPYANLLDPNAPVTPAERFRAAVLAAQQPQPSGPAAPVNPAAGAIAEILGQADAAQAEAQNRLGGMGASEPIALGGGGLVEHRAAGRAVLPQQFPSPAAPPEPTPQAVGPVEGAPAFEPDPNIVAADAAAQNPSRVAPAPGGGVLVQTPEGQLHVTNPDMLPMLGLSPSDEALATRMFVGPTTGTGGPGNRDQASIVVSRSFEGQVNPDTARRAVDLAGEIQQARDAADESAQMLAFEDAQGRTSLAQERQAQADAMAQQQLERQKRIDGMMGDFQSALTAVESNQVDPQRFFAGGNRFGAMIAVALGQLGADITGGSNNAMAIIDRAVQRDIEAQRANMENARGGAQLRGQALAQMRGILGDEAAAEEGVRAAAYTALLQRVDALMANARAGELQNLQNLRNLLAEGQQTSAQLAAQRAAGAVQVRGSLTVRGADAGGRLDQILNARGPDELAQVQSTIQQGGSRIRPGAGGGRRPAGSQQPQPEPAGDQQPQPEQPQVQYIDSQEANRRLQGINRQAQLQTRDSRAVLPPNIEVANDRRWANLSDTDARDAGEAVATYNSALQNLRDLIAVRQRAGNAGFWLNSAERANAESLQETIRTELQTLSNMGVINGESELRRLSALVPDVAGSEIAAGFLGRGDPVLSTYQGIMRRLDRHYNSRLNRWGLRTTSRSSRLRSGADPSTGQ